MSEISVLRGKLTKLQKKYDLLVEEHRQQQAVYDSLLKEHVETDRQLRRLELFKIEWFDEKNLLMQKLDSIKNHKESWQLETTKLWNVISFLENRNLWQRILNVKFKPNE